MHDLKNFTNEALFSEVMRRFACGFRPMGSASLVGPTGSGKTTQALRISELNCWCYINVDQLMQKGFSEEKDNEIVEEIRKKIGEPLCFHGAIFDGFPKSISQARKLDAMMAKENIKINRVVQMKCPENVLLQRIVGKRKIDSEEASKEIGGFYEKSNSMLQHYAAAEKLVSLDASAKPEIVWSQLHNMFNRNLE